MGTGGGHRFTRADQRRRSECEPFTENTYPS